MAIAKAIANSETWCMWVPEEGVEGSFALAKFDSEKKWVLTLSGKVRNLLGE